MAKGTRGTKAPAKTNGNEVRKSAPDPEREPAAGAKVDPGAQGSARSTDAAGTAVSKPARRILNAIEWRAPRTRSAEARTSRPSASESERPRAQRSADDRQAGLPLNAPRADPDAWTVPDSVKDRFAQDGRRYYFPDGAPAFRDHGKRLTTPSENSQVIASLIEIAQARGWDSIRVRGTDRFRQEAWKQGKLAGVEVRGYHPSSGERAALMRAVGARSDDASAQESTSSATAQGPQRAEEQAGRPSREGLKREELITGKLLAHGSEHYQFDPKADPSYYVRLETSQGRRVLWGTDFERALNESLSRAKIGDEVVVQHRGTDAVTVKRRERDTSGKVIHETPLDTHRNTWSIERSDFLEARAAAAMTLRDTSFTPKQIVKKHPELAGTLLKLHAVELAAKEFHNAEDRDAVVAGVRKALADRVARGDPLAPVQLRDRAARAAPEKVHAPER